MTNTLPLAAAVAALALLACTHAPAADKPDANGFVCLFNGKDLTGWVGSTGGYGVEDGVLYCDPKKGGNLLTEHEYADFILKFEFKVPPGGNNGLAIRAPRSGNPAYAGMELQILDNKHPKYAKLRDVQYHGSIYDVVPAKRGHLKPAGEWNSQEVRAIGPQITVILNGTTILDANLEKVCKEIPADKLKKHPGLKREGGHIGFMGHGDRVEFRNLRIKRVDGGGIADTHNTPPEGFVALFNGKDLSGWKGLVANPPKRAAMSAEQLAKAQQAADKRMREHWKVVDGVLVFDGKGSHLCTAKDYEDFEMYVDYKIGPGGDSGIYLRGSPQVQIWDPTKHKEGSGGLYNNKKNPSKPQLCADNPPGEWNRLRIRMVGEKVTVHLNGKKVVDDVTMENYWQRDKPIYETGQIELQSHGSPLYFRNIYIRELALPPKS